MGRKILLQLVVPLMGLCVLFLLMATDPMQPRQVELWEISVILREEDGSAWSSTRQGMEQAAADLGAELRILPLSRANHAQEQTGLLEREAQVGADALLLVPADRETLAEWVGHAPVPVVTMETDLGESVPYIGADNVEVGRALARSARSGAEVGERVLLLDSVPGDNGVRDRMEAAAKLLVEEGRNIRVCAPEPDQTLQQALELAVAAEQPSLVMAFEPAALETAARFFQDRKETPALCGMGATNAVAAFLEQGTISAIAAQNEYAAGYLAVEAAVQAIQRTGTPPAPLEFSMIRRETMYRPDNQKLLFTVTH